MAAVTETLDIDELVPQVTPRHGSNTTASRVARAKSQPAALRKTIDERWTSTLAPQDLRCLLSVIEDQVLPQMLRAYSPAHGLPDLSDPTT